MKKLKELKMDEINELSTRELKSIVKNFIKKTDKKSEKRINDLRKIIIKFLLFGNYGPYISYGSVFESGVWKKEGKMFDDDGNYISYKDIFYHSVSEKMRKILKSYIIKNENNIKYVDYSPIGYNIIYRKNFYDCRKSTFIYFSNLFKTIFYILKNDKLYYLSDDKNAWIETYEHESWKNENIFGFLTIIFPDEFNLSEEKIIKLPAIHCSPYNL